MYYNKQEVKNILLSAHGDAMESSLKPMSSIEEAFASIANEEDIVGYFWMSVDKLSENDLGIKLNSRVFMRVEGDLYTDDRFALDLCQAQRGGITVGDIVRERNKNLAESAKHIIDPSLKQALIEKFSDNG